ncbi:hypothetical protein NQX30_04750 [Candidatus Persebacteraceae bacterium Df01]|jgi:hypothetical protein|uniref:Uncharacterized protein n=1 Tax=Candidatus Doriopsillibacter californiensis TaxID=2970740 RepID=A0ABT7QLU4_9GAMM|nr:hypothetical protein [Candidatus Persebacteraceae bacterium Df01]
MLIVTKPATDRACGSHYIAANFRGAWSYVAPEETGGYVLRGRYPSAPAALAAAAIQNATHKQEATNRLDRTSQYLWPPHPLRLGESEGGFIKLPKN